MKTHVRRATLAMFVLLVAGACSTDTTTGTPGGSIITGLAEGQANDTITGGPPPSNPTPGSFHGYVLGPGTGPDTMATAPRIAGTQVTAYPHTGWNGTEPAVGPAAASVTTGADGAFQMPTLPGGEYLVTFTPPAASAYRGVYVLTTIHAGSGSGNWWVVLPRK